MIAFYNEIDAHCCAWLSNLMDAGHITPGVICDRSIEDLRPKDLLRYDRVHMFAGIGGWDYALNLAGWSGRVWTGSCPCQPFSAAGKGAGFEDERHLWPAWQHLIAQCRPPVVFGEQVASKAAEPWIDLVHADMEGMGYAFGCVPFPAAGVGAQFIGDRLYWIAEASTAPERHEQPRQKPRCRPAGRMGGQQQSVSWDTPWPAALASLRALDDGLPRCVAGTDAARNAIVPQQAAEFVMAYMEARAQASDLFTPPAREAAAA